ncbi:hypothetical protein BN10_590019 [Phycicoccus elongatus Lp2]|uniref:Uncharacterized protein n=1 Tax=Phycicoccus elongatus Lp2 TaxID=1193181 RepID=N0E0T7_9MICO|nr:hypothetical protein BN10_590019 [Phycicoccus elongatus Lp2]
MSIPGDVLGLACDSVRTSAEVLSRLACDGPTL